LKESSDGEPLIAEGNGSRFVKLQRRKHELHDRHDVHLR